MNVFAYPTRGYLLLVADKDSEKKTLAATHFFDKGVIGHHRERPAGGGGVTSHTPVLYSDCVKRHSTVKTIRPK